MAASAWDLPRNWGDFLNQRGEGPREDDPPFLWGRTPDVVFYGPGYHAAALDAGEYGAALLGALLPWQQDIRTRGAPVPRVHLLLNVMPAPWLLSRRHQEDRLHRTQLNEYRKNLAILAAARELDFVVSVVDLFSAELPFHGEEGGKTAHGGAVHIQDWRVWHIIGDIVLNRLCHSS